MSHNHIMVDLETLGTVPGCVAFSIGAVQFFPERQELGDEFYGVIDVESCLARYLREEPDTLAFWDRQSEEARQALEHARSGDASNIVEVLDEFNSFLKRCGNATSIRLYGNGADFDNPILRVMYDAAGVKPFMSGPAAYGGRCYRTLKNLHELFGDNFAAPKLVRQGTYHNALDDAKSQAHHLMDIVARIRYGIDVGDDLK